MPTQKIAGIQSKPTRQNLRWSPASQFAQDRKQLLILPDCLSSY